MNDNDLIELAKEAELGDANAPIYSDDYVNLKALTKFASLIEAKQEPVASNDRDMLNYLNDAFNSEVWNCPKCGHAEETSTMDSAGFLREYLATHPAPDQSAQKFKLGDRVTKTSGANWTGKVVGFYSTELTPIGYAVESDTEKGSVQIYPEKALAKIKDK